MSPRALIKPSTSTRKISTSYSITCGTLLKTSRNSRQRSRLGPTHSFARPIRENTKQENNNETQVYFSGAHALSRNSKWLRRRAAKQVLSANASQRQSLRSGSGPLPGHTAPRADHHVAPVSRRSYCLHL